MRSIPSVSRLATEPPENEQFATDRNEFNMAHVGDIYFRKSNTPEKYRSQRRSMKVLRGTAAGGSNQQIDLFAKGVLDKLVDAHALQIQDG